MHVCGLLQDKLHIQNLHNVQTQGDIKVPHNTQRLISYLPTNILKIPEANILCTDETRTFGKLRVLSHLLSEAALSTLFIMEKVPKLVKTMFTKSRFFCCC